MNSTETVFPHELAVRRGHATPARQIRRVLNPYTFQRVVDHERARSDRSGQSFAVAVFSPFSPQESAEAQEEMQIAQALLEDRVRTIDEMGWFNDRRLGVLLPYTTVETAWKLADDVASAFPISIVPPVLEVFAYPTNWPAPESDNEDDDDDNRPRRRVRQLEPYFARPLPWWKRLMDVVGAIAGLCLLSPLLLLVAIGLKLTSTGPILFTQWRNGLGGRRFRIVNFRTMVVGAEHQRTELLQQNEQDSPAFKVTNDPRYAIRAAAANHER